MPYSDFVSWHDKEGKPAAGQLEITPGSTLTVGDLEKGASLAIIICHGRLHGDIVAASPWQA